MDIKILTPKFNSTCLTFPKIIFALLLSSLVINGAAQAQGRPDRFDVITGPSPNNNWLEFSDAHYALYHYLAGQAYDLLDKRTNAIAKLHSLSAWQARQQWAKQTLMDIVGPFPKKTPLHARITKTINKDGYRVEDIIYQSQPGFYVTSSLFIPDNTAKPAPAILYCSGHNPGSYRSGVKQHLILNLVKKGFIVYAFDPIGQGERIEYYTPQPEPRQAKTAWHSLIGNSVKEHTYPGAQAFITASSLARYMVWDGIRAVDYLVSRKEVDPRRIGITGGSGGGMQTAYIAALDSRIRAAAPERWITSFKRLFQTMGPQDADQNLASFIARGLDDADFLEIRAPKPTLMITATRGFFSIRGAKETAKEVSRIYEAYGKTDNFGMVEDDATHRSTEKNREAMYAFFQKYLNNPGNSADENVKPLSLQALQVTRTGEVATSLEGETVFSLNRKKAEKEEKQLQASREEDLSRHLSKALKAAKDFSGYQKPDSVDQPVFTGRFDKGGYAIDKYFVKGAGHYPVPYLLFVPDKPNHKAVIYLDPDGKTANLHQEEWFARRGYTVLAPDLLGEGEMKIKSGDFPGAGSLINGVDVSDWFASILIGRSVVGVQAGDVVRLTRLLQKRKDIREVYGLAYGRVGPVLLHAAAFDKSIARIALLDPYSSYRSIVMHRFYKFSFIPSTVAGSLEAYDLPDLAASLAPRKLLVAGIMDGRGRVPADLSNVYKDINVIKAAYQHKNASKGLKIMPWKSVEGTKGFSKILTQWGG